VVINLVLGGRFPARLSCMSVRIWYRISLNSLFSVQGIWVSFVNLLG
jgi:hypothetical protein